MENQITEEQIELLRTMNGDPRYPYLNKENFDKFLNGELKDFLHHKVDELFKNHKKIMTSEFFRENILSYYTSIISINPNEKKIIKAYDLDIFEDNTFIISKLEDKDYIISLDQLRLALEEQSLPTKNSKTNSRLRGIFKIDGSQNLFFMKGKDGTVFCVMLTFYRLNHKWYLSAEELLDKGHISGSRVFIGEAFQKI